MNENIKVNNKRRQMDIFKSLLAVEVHPSFKKSRDEMLKELKHLEEDGKLRIYYPEEDN